MQHSLTPSVLVSMMSLLVPTDFVFLLEHLSQITSTEMLPLPTPIDLVWRLSHLLQKESMMPQLPTPIVRVHELPIAELIFFIDTHVSSLFFSAPG